jgi:hypothetical protein
MPSLARHFWKCLDAIVESINDTRPITYGELAKKLNLRSSQQEWHTVLNLIAAKTKDEIGDDLTWNVVYASGRAKGLGRYFSNGKKLPGSTLLDPRDRLQVAEYERKLKELYDYTYELRRVDGKDTIVKTPRS